MNYSDLLNPSGLIRRAKRPFNHSVVDDIRHSISKVEFSTASLIAISAAASVGAGLAYYFLNKRHRPNENQSTRSDSYLDSTPDSE